MRGLNKHIKTSTEHTNKWLNQNLPTVPGLILWGKCEQRLTSYRAPKVKCFSHVPSSPLASLLPHAAGDYTPQTAMGSRAVSGNGRIWDPSQVLVLGIAARKAAAAKLGDAAPSSSQGGLGSCELPNSKVGTTQHPRGPAPSLCGSKGWQGWTNNPIIVLQIIWGEKTNKQTIMWPTQELFLTRCWFRTKPNLSSSPASASIHSLPGQWKGLQTVCYKVWFGGTLWIEKM